MSKARTNDEIDQDADFLHSDDVLRTKIAGYASDAVRVMNPCSYGPDEIYAEAPDLSLENIGDPVDVRLEDASPLGPPKIKAEVVKSPTELKSEAPIEVYDPEREESIEWDGTSQTRNKGAERRRQLSNENDPRGKDNNLLKGDQ